MRLDGERIGNQLAVGRTIGRRIEVLDECSSTNDEMARRGEAGEAEGLVVFAEEQGGGRGRRGAAWHSERGSDLLFSVLLRPPGGVAGWAWLTHGAAVAICRVIESMFALPAMIKWPNDVQLPGNRKVCGILLETGGGSGGSFCVLGIGLNVNGESFPDDLRASAVSLRMASGAGEALERELIAGVVLGELETIYGTCMEEGGERALLREAERRSVLLGREVEVWTGKEKRVGRVLGLGQGGGLRVKGGMGEEWEFSGSERVRLVGR